MQRLQGTSFKKGAGTKVRIHWLFDHIKTGPLGLFEIPITARAFTSKNRQNQKTKYPPIFFACDSSFCSKNLKI
jgi:hypothetical protein